jgi:hypothetical protein
MLNILWACLLFFLENGGFNNSETKDGSGRGDRRLDFFCGLVGRERRRALVGLLVETLLEDHLLDKKLKK